MVIIGLLNLEVKQLKMNLSERELFDIIGHDFGSVLTSMTKPVLGLLMVLWSQKELERVVAIFKMTQIDSESNYC